MPTVITGSDLSFTPRFILNSSPIRFSVIDTTDYSSYSIPLTNVFGCLTIVSPSGVTIYNNTTFTGVGCDIKVTTSTTQQSTVQLPSLGNGYPESGIYTITYTVSINDGVHSTYQISSDATDFDYTYVKPTASITSEVDCCDAYFTTEDITDYVVDGITPTNTRSMTLTFPSGSGLSVITNTTSATITVGSGQFATGAQVTAISSVLSYTYPDGLVVIDTVTGTKNLTVDCTLACELYCCENSMYLQLQNYKGVNEVMYQSLLGTFTYIMALETLFKKAIGCGKQTDASALATAIKTLANCTDDCQCTDGAPRLVYGLGTSNVNVVVASGGPPVTVTSTTVGGVTTYTVTLSGTFVNLVNNSYNTIVAAGTNVTVASSGTNPVTYTVNATVPATQNHLDFLCRIQPANFAVPVHTITNSAYQYSGSNIGGTAAVTCTDIANPNFATMNNCYTVTTFQTSANTNFKPSVQIDVQGIDNTLIPLGMGTVTAAQMKGVQAPLRADIIDRLSGSFKFRFVYAYGPNVGLAPANNILVAFPDIYCTIKITE